MDNLSDEELAARAAAGSRVAFEELISRYTRRLFYFLRPKSESDEDIEDLIQETFLRTFRNIERFDPKRKFSTWLYTTAVRLAISRHRSNKTRTLGLGREEPECPSPGPAEILIQKEETQRDKNIWNLAGTLKPREYEVLWLRYAEDLPVNEIARAMNKSPLGIRVLLHRARRNLGGKLRPPAHSVYKEETKYALPYL
jgi:RNA polymerase sigma-70 factor (ECF subfamily)